MSADLLKRLATVYAGEAVRGDPMRVFDLSNLWLGPLQGLVAAGVGALFFSKSRPKDGSGVDGSTLAATDPAIPPASGDQDPPAGH